MIIYNSVKFKDRKSFDKNKTKKNVRAVYEDLGLIVFKDRSPVIPNKQKVSHTYSFGSLKKGIPTPTVYLRAKHYLPALEFCKKNNLKIIQEMEKVNWIVIELPEHVSFEKFHAFALASNLFLMCSQHMHINVSPAATNYTYNQIWQLPALQVQEAWDEIALDPPPTYNVITVVDWACDTNHPDMVGQTFNNYNMNTGTTNVLPFAQGGEVSVFNQVHGTGAASQIVAKNDGTYATGISPYDTKVSFVYINLIGSVPVIGGVAFSSFMYGLYHCMQMGNCIGSSNSYINGSAQVPGPPSNAEQEFVYDALQYGRGGDPNLNTPGLGVLAFCANGNGPSNGGSAPPPNRPIYPASYDGVIAVTATEFNGGNYKKTFWADYGTVTFCAAPGMSTPSSYPGNETTLFGGTSGATPITAGVAALIHAARPELSANGIKEVLKNSCRKIYTYDYNIFPSDPGKSVEVGYGQVDAYAAVQYAKYSGIIDPGPGVQQNLRILLSGSTLTTVDSQYTLQYTLLLTKISPTPINVTVTLFYSLDTVYTGADPVITTIPVTIPANDYNYIATHTFTVPNTLNGDVYWGANVTTIPDETVTIDNTAFYGVFVIGDTPPPNLNLRVEIDTVSYDPLIDNKVKIAYEIENTGLTPITTFTLKKGFVGFEEREYRLEVSLETDEILNVIDEWSDIPPLNVLYTTPYRIEITSVNNIQPDNITSDNVSIMYLLPDSPNP
jgi:hypothetical protein